MPHLSSVLPVGSIFASPKSLRDLLPPMGLSALPYAPAYAKAAPSSPTPTAAPTPAPETSHPVMMTDTATDALEVKNSPGYSFDKEALLHAPISVAAGSPLVLIVHTHTSEAYAPSENFQYTATDTYRTEDTAYNVCRVGDALAKTLEAHGIGTLHDTTSHDYPSYSGCYGRSLETIEKNLAAHPSIQVVIDLHRDALLANDGSYMKTAAEIGGETIAQALVVIGTDAGGLSHPDWQKNLSLGLKLQKKLCDMYPGLARPLHLRTERFNGHASPGSLLLEIGSCGNTMEEALACAEKCGEALASLLAELTI